jgi:hypothetical protein
MAAFLCGRKIVDRLHHPALWLTGMIVGFALSRAVICWSSNWTILSETLFGAATVALLAFGKFNSREGRITGLARFFGEFRSASICYTPHNDLIRQRAPTLTTIVNAGIHRSSLRPLRSFVRSRQLPLCLAAISIHRAAVYQIRSGTAV